MATTTVTAAKANLLTMLAARAGLAGVNIVWGYLSDSAQVRPENIIVGDADVEEDWAALGQKRRDEDYTIQVVVAVRQAGDDQRAAEERMWALVNEVDNAIHADPTLSGAVQHAGVTRKRQTNVPEPGAWTTQATLTVTCHAPRYLP